MKIKEQIANFFTLMNLVCGVVAISFILENDLGHACLFVFIGALFDFFDGFIARALGIASEMGKQLDSLSDVVTFGVVPGLIAHRLFLNSFEDGNYLSSTASWFSILVPALIPAFSALRLAKFNIDTRQSKNFIGLPTPANAMLWISFGWIMSIYQSGASFWNWWGALFYKTTSLLHDTIILSIFVFVSCFLMVAPISLMGFKFDKFGWNGNEMKLSLIVISIPLFIFLLPLAIPIILLLYILFSIIHFYVLKKT